MIETKEEFIREQERVASVLRNADVLAFDTESPELGAYPYRYSLATKDEAFSFAMDLDHYHKYGHWWDKNLLKELLSSKKIIMHNAKYDMKVMLTHFGIEIPDYEDTMVMAHLYDENERKGLKETAMRLLGVEDWNVDIETKKGKGRVVQNLLPDERPIRKWKNELKKLMSSLEKKDFTTRLPDASESQEIARVSALTRLLQMTEEEYQAEKLIYQQKADEVFNASQQKVWKSEVEYSRLDARYTFDLFYYLYPKLEELGLAGVDTTTKTKKGLYEVVEKPLIRVLVDMELHGVPIDLQKLKDIEVRATCERDALDLEIRSILSPDDLTAINLASTQQLSRALFDSGMCQPVEPRGKTGEYSTRGEILELLAQEYPIAQKIVRLRDLSKLLSTFMFNTDRIYSNFNQVGAGTGRFTSSQPNLQQVPTRKDYNIRACFIPEKGHKMLVADYCVAEGQRVLTTRGLIKVEDVSLRDSVLDEKGDSYQVRNTCFSGERECLRIESDNGSIIEVTPEHKVRILNTQTGVLDWKEAGKLTVGDYILVAGQTCSNEGLKFLPTSSQYTQHYNSKDFCVPAFLEPSLAKFMGILTGDGILNSERQVSVICCDRDKDFQKWLSEYMLHTFRVDVAVKQDKGSTIYAIYRRGLHRWLTKSLGVSKVAIPDIIWESSKEVKGAYLSGLFETDGSINSGDFSVISFASKNEHLVRQVQVLLLSIGIHSRIRKNTMSYTYKESGVRAVGWQISIGKQFFKRFQEDVGFISERKKHILSEEIEKSFGDNESRFQYPYIEEFSKKSSVEADFMLRNQRNLKRNLSFSLAKDLLKLPEYAKLESLQLYSMQNLIYSKIISIEPIGVKRTYDLQIDGKEQFILNGVVTHNSQIELRLTAFFSKDPEMLRCYREGIDIHSRTAKASFNLPCAVEDVKELYPERRSQSKAINFGLIYGMASRKLAEVLKISQQEADIAYRGYFETYPFVQNFMNNTKAQASKMGYVKTYCWRRRRVPELPYLKSLNRSQLSSEEWKRMSSLEREAGNAVIQGSAADLVKKAMVDMYEPLKAIGAKMLMTIHDEIVVSCPENKVEEGLRILKDCMEKALPGINEVVPIVAEPVVCDNWAEGK